MLCFQQEVQVIIPCELSMFITTMEEIASMCTEIHNPIDWVNYLREVHGNHSVC